MTAATLVSLTFDDALDVHLDAAMPLLEQHGLRGTFYVNVGSESFTSRQRDWAAAAGRGHELGNHTVFHPGVSSKSWVTPGIALDGYNLDRMRHELIVANRILKSIDGAEVRSFAFPCSNPWLGRPGWPRRLLTRLNLQRTRLMGFIDRHGLDVGSRLVDYTPLVRELFPAARCGGVAVDELPRRPGDWQRVRAVEGDDRTLADLRRALDVAVERKAWIVFVFHGVGGGHHMSIDRSVFAEFIAVLAADPRVAVHPFIDAATRLRAERA
jgi:peptidoglycan/xylan/chitin deacetylase (PgdA/CDA1 family)